MKEVWKDIFFVEKNVVHDYRGLYQVSNFGNVKSLGNHKSPNSKEKKLKLRTTHNGYFRVTLSKGRPKSFFVHRLVAHMFVPNNDINRVWIDHIDGDRKNNHVNNLKWCTHSENLLNPITRKRLSDSGKGKEKTQEAKENMSKAKKGKPQPYSKLIARFTIDGELLDIHYAFQYKEFGFEPKNIIACCKGKQKTHRGFKWEYVGGEKNEH